MTTIILLNGKGGSGKDTLCKSLSYKLKIMKISSIEPVKQIARKEFGWSDDMKDAISRKMLSSIKDFIWSNNKEKIDKYLYNQCADGIKAKVDAIFIDIREPEQIDYYKNYLSKTLNTTVKTLLITREETNDIVYRNHADDCVNDYKYDYTFENKTCKGEAEFRKLIDSFTKLIKDIIYSTSDTKKLEEKIALLNNVCVTLLDLTEQLSKYANSYTDKMYIQNTIYECRKIISSVD